MSIVAAILEARKASRDPDVYLPAALVPAPRVVNVHEAKTNLSKLLAAVEAGDVVVIARGGKPIARLVPDVPAPKAKRRTGWGKGRYAGADLSVEEFNAIAGDEIALMGTREPAP